MLNKSIYIVIDRFKFNCSRSTCSSLKILVILEKKVYVRMPIKQKTPSQESLVSAKGLEPLTNGLKGHCSTIELRAHSEGDFIIARI